MADEIRDVQIYEDLRIFDENVGKFTTGTKILASRVFLEQFVDIFFRHFTGHFPTMNEMNISLAINYYGIG